MYLYYMEFSFFKSVFMTQTIGEAFREAVLALPSNLSPEKRRGEIAKILDQFLKDNENFLKNADLSSLDLQEVDFSEADLSEANLRGTDLRDASFRDTNLNNAQMDDHTQLSGATGLLLLIGLEDENGKRQNNTINITPNVQFPDDVVDAFREAIKTNQNFLGQWQPKDSFVHVSVKKLTLKIPEGDFQTFKTSIQNQIKNHGIETFIQKVKELGYPEKDITSGAECVSDIGERIEILNNLIKELRDQNGIFDIAGADLSGLDLRSLDLHKTNFTGCKLSGTNLLGSNLTDAILTDAITDDQTQWPQDYNSSGHARD